MLADNSDALVAYEPPLSESEGEYSAHELAERREASMKKHDESKLKQRKKKRAPAKKKAAGFRMHAKRFSLTFPKCSTSKSDAAARIDHKWDQCAFVIGQEKHKDGDLHLHLYLEFPEKMSFSDSGCFDFITGQHGNYQTTKSRRDWINYVVKEDAEYTAKGIDVKSILRKQKPMNQSIAELIHEGKTLEEIDADHKGYVMMNKRKIEEYAAWVKMKKSRKEKEEFVPPDFTKLTGAHRKIGQWITENVKCQREFKAPQLFIHGPPDHGKSTLIRLLEKSLSVYHIPLSEDFYDSYEDGAYDLAVLDEFRGHKQIQWLNQWLDGQVMSLRKKGSQCLKTQNIPTIILSNYPLERCYAKAVEDHGEEIIAPLRARLREVQVDEFIKIY